MGRHEATSETRVNAPAAKVWEVLTDLAGFPKWVAFVTTVKPHGSAALKKGSRFVITAKTTNHELVSEVQVTAFEPRRKLAWTHLSDTFDGAPFGMVGDGMTAFVLEEHGKTTTVRAQIAFTAKTLAAKFGAGLFLNTRIKPQLETTLHQLKKRCE